MIATTLLALKLPRGAVSSIIERVGPGPRLKNGSEANVAMNVWQLKRQQRNLYSQMPLLGGWLRRRAAEALARDDSVSAARVLAEAVTRSDDARVRSVALEALRQLRGWRTISAVCGVWADTRHADLSALLAECEWVASTPPEVKVLTALKVGRADKVTKGKAKTIEPLVNACQDADPVIAERARQALEELSEHKAEELCAFLIWNEHPLALDVATRAGYVPKQEQQRALFFFMTEQWQRYDDLDFDRQLLRATYTAAVPGLRRRILLKLRVAGRTDFLTVVAGGDYVDRAAEATYAELELLVQTLVSNGEWAILWKLVFETPFSWSARIVMLLADSGWRPDEREQAIFADLAALAEQDLPTNEQELEQLFPPALLQAQARVPGRINDVAFAPARPTIAIGTGGRKLVLWSYQRAERERLLSGFNHSIGHVAFAGDDRLFCAERTNAVDDPCAIYGWNDVWNDERSFRLGRHKGSVTAIAPLGDSRLLSSGRDSEVVLWNLNTGRKTARRQNNPGSWARAMRVSPDGQQVALLAQGLELVTLPQLDRMVGIGYNRGVIRCAAFSPDGGTLFAGRFNGKVTTYEYKPQRTWLMQEPGFLTRHEGRVEGVEILQSRSIIVTAGSEGCVRFIDLRDRETIGEVQVPLGQVTSLRISPDESFMAVGNSKASLSLWDLRVLDVRALTEHPFGQVRPASLSILNVMVNNENLPTRARLVLRFIDCVLRHRFQFDIEIEDAPTIMMGEFDIEIEE